jgi:hypothetical protein
VTSVAVHDSPLARIASDHLPVKASIDLKAAQPEQRDGRRVEAGRTGAA